MNQMYGFSEARHFPVCCKPHRDFSFCSHEQHLLATLQDGALELVYMEFFPPSSRPTTWGDSEAFFHDHNNQRLIPVVDCFENPAKDHLYDIHLQRASASLGKMNPCWRTYFSTGQSNQEMARLTSDWICVCAFTWDAQKVWCFFWTFILKMLGELWSIIYTLPNHLKEMKFGQSLKKKTSHE